MEPGFELDEGRFRIVRLIGTGETGAVYEAEHTTTHKRVAVKCLHRDAQTPRTVERLWHEAQACARVRHPNSVEVYDVGCEADVVFLVMELLEGETFAEFLARDELPLCRRIALLLPAMRAVAFAHRQGVVHRDIKPDNIFLARELDVDDPVPKVLDFGISKLEPLAGDATSIAQLGTTLGTPRYMSFERLTGIAPVDERADVYAFGVILYEALTGRAPYDAESNQALIAQLLERPTPSARQLRPEIPAALDRLVAWALAREREDRLPSLDVFLRELEPFATATGFSSGVTELTQAETNSREAPVVPRLHGSSFGSTARTGSAPARFGVILAILMLLVAGAFVLVR